MRRSVPRRTVLHLRTFAGLIASLVSLAGSPPLASASHTPNPTSVTIAGSLDPAFGCAGAWDPSCAAAHLAYDASDDVWQQSWTIPTGNWEYKAALNDSWNENYGLHAAQGGANIPLALGASTLVKFYYDHKTHWVTDNHNSIIATVPGSYQTQLGCPGDWDPSCLRSWLEDPSGSGIYSFETTALPQGTYEAKVAINESWSENYGAGGVPNGANIPFTVPTAGQRVRFSYNPETHVLTVTLDSTPTPTMTPTVTPTPTLIPLGDSCSRGAECASTFCASGVCCNAPCSNPGQSCNQPGSAGLCRAEISGVPAASQRGIVGLSILLAAVGVGSLISVRHRRRS